MDEMVAVEESACWNRVELGEKSHVQVDVLAVAETFVRRVLGQVDEKSPALVVDGVLDVIVAMDALFIAMADFGNE